MCPIHSNTLLANLKIPCLDTIIEEKFLVTELYPSYLSMKTVEDLAVAAGQTIEHVIATLSWIKSTIPKLPVSWNFCEQHNTIFVGIYSYQRYAYIKSRRRKNICFPMPHIWAHDVLGKNQNKKFVIVADNMASSLSATLFLREKGYLDSYYLKLDERIL